MARLRALGRKAMTSSGARKAAIGIGLTAVAAQGFGKGFASNDLSDPFYQLTLGSPKADQDVTGAEINPFSLMYNPFSEISTITGHNPLTKTLTLGGVGFGTTGPLGALGGAAAGVGLGAKLSKGLSATKRFGRMSGLGILGAGLGVGLAINRSESMNRLRAANSAGLLNDRTFSGMRYADDEFGRFYQDNKYSNSPPQVDGSLAFGLYNARQGR